MIIQRLVHIPAVDVHIEGMLEVPDDARGLVLFAHGSESSRHSPRNNYVARVMREAHLGTLLMDLLTPREDETDATRFDIGLLTQRLIAATHWVRQLGELTSLPMGLFGSSIGAAAAMQAAAALPTEFGAVVSRGGRPDLAGKEALKRVRAPTLLLVGSLDEVVIELNRSAAEFMLCEKTITIIPGATHLFEERGALEQVAAQAATWFAQHFDVTSHV